MKKIILLLLLVACSSCATLERWRTEPLRPKPISAKLAHKRQVYQSTHKPITNPQFDIPKPIIWR